MEIIVGTAGHIDHGKTALVRALTGTDADRLPEEKKRGITIDIGFAELRLGDTHFGFVDVPGHERFVKNMLAGASGIDLVLLVIAADEGVMPQTREHFEICRLLGLKQGIVVLTKCDLVDDETLELAKLDAAEVVEGSFLEDASVVAVSSVTGQGIDELKTLLIESAAGVAIRNEHRDTFLPIDRSFTVKGFGSVVTGTLASGTIAEGSELELLPEGRHVRVRGVQTHGRAVASARGGQRTAVNLGGIDHGDLSRGMVLSKPGLLRSTQIFDSILEVLATAPRPLRSRQRVRVHVGTAEVLARVSVINGTGEIVAGESGLVQFRLETPLVCFLGERFIVRSYSPQTTLGGGQVLSPTAEKIRKKDIGVRSGFLRDLFGSIQDRIRIAKMIAESVGEKGASIADLQAVTGWLDETAKDAIRMNLSARSLVEVSDRFISADAWSSLRNRTLAAMDLFHKTEPLAIGISREALRDRVFNHLPGSIFGAIVASLESEGVLTSVDNSVRLSTFESKLSATERSVSERLTKLYIDADLEPPKLDEVFAGLGGVPAAEARKLLQMLVKDRVVVKVTDDFYFASAAIDRLSVAVRKWADTTKDRLIDVGQFKEIAGVSRKYAIPLLECFDRDKVTVRAGEKRVVLK